MKHQVLIVEDNEINREMLKSILSDDYSILEAENGREALDILESNKENIALILLDVMMPVMDGYTFLDIIKKDSVLSLIPVIVTTQSDSEVSEIAALEHGATDFVSKPYRPQIIRAERSLPKAIRCDYAQGYFYAKPIPSEEYEELLRS